MRERNVTRKSSLIIALCAVALVALAGSARAQVDPIGLITEMSAAGVSRGQIARPNVYYRDLFPPRPCAQDRVCTPPASFDATLTLYFADTAKSALFIPGRMMGGHVTWQTAITPS